MASQNTRGRLPIIVRELQPVTDFAGYELWMQRIRAANPWIMIRIAR